LTPTPNPTPIPNGLILMFYKVIRFETIGFLCLIECLIMPFSYRLSDLETLGGYRAELMGLRIYLFLNVPFRGLMNPFLKLQHLVALIHPI
jgi:hypothetical protein